MAKIKLSTLLLPLQDVDRPTSNPLPPQSEAFADHQNAQQALETVAQQVPNFGTEQACLFFQSVYLKFSICNYCIIFHFYYICLFIMVNHVFIIYGRIKLIVLSIWRLELVGLVRDAAEFIFTLINRALCSSRICIMVSGLLGSKMRGSRYVIADSCILIRTLPNFYTFVQFVGSFYIRIVLAI